ncbi:MAG: HNH endonuclease [Syntrophorhabdaceae bacterium]|nr:HNH endonuclease [Syntrophorhabdaceae bacterium]
MDYIRIYKTEVPNAKKTLDTAVVLNDVYQQIKNSILKDTFREILPHGSLYFWDFGVKAGRELKNGMSVSIICGNKKYDCLLIEIIEDPKGELGDIFGWARQFQAPWKNVCALTMLNEEHISSDNIVKIVSKTMPVTKSFLKVTDPELKLLTYSEGKIHDLTLTIYERNRLARRACIAHYGYVCSICNFDFYNTYGEIGKGYIHVHHKVPLAMIKDNYRVDPIKDLVPVCPNCHAMLHANQKEMISVENLKEILTNHNKEHQST